MAEKKAKGFHALEKRIHDMETAHEGEEKKAPVRETKPAEGKPAEVSPPPAHDE